MNPPTAIATPPMLQPGMISPAEHAQQLVQQIIMSESVEEQLGSALKAFYKLQRQEAIIDQLSIAIQAKEQEIEKVCNSHYQDFVHSVDKLLEVRVESQSLKDKFDSFQSDYRDTVVSYLDKKRTLANYRAIYLNIDETLTTVQSCLFVLELAAKVSLYIEEKNYYTALKILEELQNNYLQQLAEFEFAGLLVAAIPQIQNDVKSAAISSLNEWFVNIRDWSRTVGQLAIQRCSKELSKEGVIGDIQASIRQLSRSSSVLRKVRKGSASKLSQQSLSWESLDEALSDSDDFDIFNNGAVTVDFRPLYQCIHIHEVLTLKNSLKSNYEENRRLQVNLILSTQFSFNEHDLTGFEKYLHDIVGFFIVEAHVVSSTDNFRSRANVEISWDAANEKLHEVVKQSLQHCQSPTHFLKIKELMIIFVTTMENYQFSVNRLLALLMTFFEQYSNLTMITASGKCDDSINLDCGERIIAGNVSEFNAVMDVYYYEPAATAAHQKLIFPVVFPFSQSFIDCFREVKGFVTGFYQFGEGFHQQFNEMTDILKKSVEMLITNHVCTSIETKFSSPKVNLPEVVRIIVNMEFFLSGIKEIEKIIVNKRSSSRLESPKHSDLHRADLEREVSSNFTEGCSRKLKETKKKAENRIFELVNSKIDDFLDLAEYDYCPMDPSRSGSPTKSASPKPLTKVSSYLEDMVSYLDVVWNSTFDELPLAVKSFIYYEAIYHIVTKLLRNLTDANVKKISPLFVERDFQVDIIYLETFVSKLGDPNLPEMLLELKQVMLLLLPDSNPEEYLNPKMKNKKYSRVLPTTALSLLERVRESGFWNDSSSFFGSLSNSQQPKDKVDRAAKRKQLDQTIKQLKEDYSKK